MVRKGKLAVLKVPISPKPESPRPPMSIIKKLHTKHGLNQLINHHQTKNNINACMHVCTVCVILWNVSNGTLTH